MKTFQILLLLEFLSCYLYYCHNVCDKTYQNCSLSEKRYLFYDINFPEGFNLRRDVYVRFAVLTHELEKSNNPLLKNFHLILPPWSHMVHWKHHIDPEHIPWGLYFDLGSLKKFAPVMEMHEFFNEYRNKYSKVIIDEVYTLQHFDDMFETGNFEDRMEINECQKTYKHLFFFFKNISSKSYHCLSYHGPVTKLKELFLKTAEKSILIEHAEVALHSMFGNKIYWKARRSMRFNKDLKSIAAKFRKTFLDSTDERDNTILPDDWLQEKAHRNAKGGPYVAIHVRRKDFIRSRPNEASSIADIAQQTEKILKKLKLKNVFLATDGLPEEFDELSSRLSKYKVLRYEPTEEVKMKYKDGGIAIIDQIICSHARYFIGTHESTFSFRIQEEREIIGFHSDTTFNAFCNNDKCPKPSEWKIVY